MIGLKMSRSGSVDVDVAEVVLVLLRSSFNRAREDVRERGSAQVVQRDPASTSRHSAPTSYKEKMNTSADYINMSTCKVGVLTWM